MAIFHSVPAIQKFNVVTISRIAANVPHSAQHHHWVSPSGQWSGHEACRTPDCRLVSTAALRVCDNKGWKEGRRERGKERREGGKEGRRGGKKRKREGGKEEGKNLEKKEGRGEGELTFDGNTLGL